MNLGHNKMICCSMGFNKEKIWSIGRSVKCVIAYMKDLHKNNQQQQRL